MWILTDSDRHGPPCGVALVKYDFAKKVNLSPVKMRKTDSQRSLRCASGCDIPRDSSCFVVTRGGIFRSFAIKRVRPLAKEGRWGYGRPPPSPRGFSPITPYWSPTGLVIATFSRMLPQMDRLRTWGKRDAKSRGENRRRRGCRIERFRWDHLTPLSA